MNQAYQMVRWEEIERAARKLFCVWVDGGELQWAEECWKHFTEKGLTNNSTVLEYTKTYLRLIALARYYYEFCGCAWNEDPDTNLVYLAEHLTIDPVALGILAASANAHSFENEIESFQLQESALLAVTDSLRCEIFDCLSEAYGGEVGLYSRMSKTDHSPDVEDDDDEFDVTGPNQAAYLYVVNGFTSG
jgi:hypothetical protein